MDFLKNYNAMNNKYLITLGVLSAICACQKEEGVIIDKSQPESTQELRHIQFNSLLTKTTIDGAGVVVWEANEDVSIWYLDSSNNPHEVVAKTDGAGTSTTMSIDIPVEHNPDHYYAAYPAGSGELSYDGAEEHFTISVGAGDGSFKAANYMAAYTTDAAKSFSFKNAVGIIRIALPASGKVDGKTITEISVAGQAAPVVSRGSVEAVITTGAVTGFSDAVSSGAEDYAYTTVDAAAISSGYAYIPTLSGAFTGGIAVRYNDHEDLIPAVLPKNAVTISRGHILPVPDLSGHIIKEWYVSAAGTGNGESAGTPMGINDVIAKFGATNTIGGAWHLNGTTFHFAADTYTLTEPLNFPLAAEHFETALEGVGAATTVLDGNSACKVITIENNDMKLALGNMTVKNGSGDHGAGIDIVPGEAVESDEKLVVDAENCVFSGNATSEGGGAIYSNANASKGIIRFNNCLFSSNAAGKLGGALLAGEGIFFMFNSCSFVSNSAVGAGGHVIYMNNAACRLGMNNCTVYHSDANNAKNEGAIAARGFAVISNTTILMDPSNPLNATNWGCIGLIPASDGSGLVINSVLHGTNAIRGLNVFAHYKYCVYTSELGATVTINDSYEYSSFPAPTEETATVNSIEQTYYTWSEDFRGQGDFPDDYVSAASIESAIIAVPSIGATFATWINSKGGLSKDIIGTDRTSDGYIYPGSIQL